jgi:hypothetical protein
MPQIYIREDQYDDLISLDFDSRDELLEFVRAAIALGIEKVKAYEADKKAKRAEKAKIARQRRKDAGKK